MRDSEGRGDCRHGDPRDPQSAGDRLRQLSRRILDGPPSHASQRLGEATAQAGDWMARGLIGRTAAVTVLSVAAQAAGVGQTEALYTIRRVFSEGNAR